MINVCPDMDLNIVQMKYYLSQIINITTSNVLVSQINKLAITALIREKTGFAY